jgi:ferrochelatase
MKKGALLVNLGSPLSPSPTDVRNYLHEFLLDKKVLDLPYLWTQFIVRGIIIPRRYKESAKSYQKIWTEEGSPLIAYSLKLESYLRSQIEGVEIHVAMRYQEPSLSDAIEALKKKEVEELLLFPLFPQFAEATTGSIIDKVKSELKRQKYNPRLKIINSFASEPFFINPLVERGKNYPLGDYDHILCSFHGLPVRHLKKAAPSHCGQKENACCKTLCSANKDCYAAQCFATAEALQKGLNLDSNRFSICFQSRLGKEPWIEPYTSKMIENLGRQGAKKVLVFCPSFVSDCLETLYEIGEEYDHLFKSFGGDKLDFVEGLNTHPSWFQGVEEKIKTALHLIQPVFANKELARSLLQ